MRNKDNLYLHFQRLREIAGKYEDEDQNDEYMYVTYKSLRVLK